jgi:hypothetical protein
MMGDITLYREERRSVNLLSLLMKAGFIYLEAINDDGGVIEICTNAGRCNISANALKINSMKFDILVLPAMIPG